jgi:hypothetical protein
MRAWITKYALTSGVFTVEAELCSDTTARMIKFRRSSEHYVEYAHGMDWHTSRSDAMDRVDDMIAAKIKSLQKQLKKLESMTIEVPE